MKQVFGYLLLISLITIIWSASIMFFSRGDTAGGFVCFGIGSIFASLLVFAVVSEVRAKTNRDFVEKSYEVVNTELNYVEALSDDLFYVHTKWVDPDGGAEYFFKSRYLAYNPERFLKGKSIPVKISTTNYKRYVVDLSMLPKKA